MRWVSCQKGNQESLAALRRALQRRDIGWILVILMSLRDPLKQGHTSTGGTSHKGKRVAGGDGALYLLNRSSMKTFKIENYEREHGSGTFIAFRHLSPEQAEDISQTLVARLGLPTDTSSSGLVSAVLDRSSLLPGVCADVDEFDLSSLFARCGIEVSSKTYLNWYRYDDIDELDTKDLIKHFDYLWYPSADDLDLIDSNKSWIISIQHSGSIRLLRFTET